MGSVDLTIKCPACGKVNAAAPEGICQRCGTDLSTLFRIRQAALHHLLEAAAALRQADWDEALAEAEKSWTLRHSMASARLAFMAAASVGHTESAATWWRRTARGE